MDKLIGVKPKLYQLSNQPIKLISEKITIKPNKNKLASTDVQHFISNPTKFSQLNVISTEKMSISRGELNEGGIQFIEIERGIYEVAFINDINTSSNENSFNSYILNCNDKDPTSKHPNYVDIPKVATDIEFLFTGTLTGGSIIVTELDTNTYRVYRDERINSSILYDNIVIAIDYYDYRFSVHDDSTATAYMQYINGSWQLTLQKQKYKTKYGTSIPILFDGKKSLSIYHPDENTILYKKQQFLNYREKLHTQLSNFASKFDVATSNIKDEPYVSGEFSLEILSEKPWCKVISETKGKMKVDIENIKLEQKKWEYEVRYLKSLGYWTAEDESRIKTLEAKINKSKLYLHFYETQSELLFSEVQEAEQSWFWFQIKEKQGMSAVINESSVYRRDIESEVSINKRYHNLVYIHKNSNNSFFISNFNDGIKRFHEIKIPGVEVGMTSNQLKLIYLNDELSAQERGALYHYIKEHENEEYIKNVLMKTGEISELFNFNGSQFNRLAPQDFYLSLVGDESNGRCYPLVRAMSVALSNQGHKVLIH